MYVITSDTACVKSDIRNDMCQKNDMTYDGMFQKWYHVWHVLKWHQVWHVSNITFGHGILGYVSYISLECIYIWHWGYISKLIAPRKIKHKKILASGLLEHSYCFSDFPRIAFFSFSEWLVGSWELGVVQVESSFLKAPVPFLNYCLCRVYNFNLILFLLHWLSSEQSFGKLCDSEGLEAVTPVVQGETKAPWAGMRTGKPQDLAQELTMGVLVSVSCR